VGVLDAGKQLICKKKVSEGELPVAEVKQTFEGRTQEIDDHRVSRIQYRTSTQSGHQHHRRMTWKLWIHTQAEDA
jgi:hypothetical protein